MWELAVGTISMAAKTMRGLILAPGTHQSGAVAHEAAGTLSPARIHHMAKGSLGNSGGRTLPV